MLFNPETESGYDEQICVNCKGSFAKNLIKEGLCDECIKGGECGFNFDIMRDDLREWIFCLKVKGGC